MALAGVLFPVVRNGSTGAGGFLLGAAAAAVIQGFLLWLIPDMGWAMQLSVFGAGTLVFTVIWWFFLRRPGQNTKSPCSTTEPPNWWDA